MKIKRMKRILAVAGLLLLAVIYLATFILGLTGKAETKDLLMACIVCTVIVPVLMYAMMMVAKILSREDDPSPPGDDTPQK